MIKARTLLSPVLVSLGLCLALAASAEPATAEQNADANAGTVQKPPAPGSGDAAADAQGSSKTIQMLLELQGSTAAPDSGDRARRDLAVRPKAATAASAANPFATQNPFGGGLEATRQSGRDGTPSVNSIDWKEGLAGPGIGAGSGTNTSISYGSGSRDAYGGSRPGPSADDDVDVRSWMPASLMRFVRQNREMVLLGSLMVLVIVWLGAATASSKRH